MIHQRVLFLGTTPTTTKLYVNLVDADVKLAHKKHGVVDRMRF